MDEFELTQKYFDYVKIVARAFGMWPYDTNRGKYVRQYFLYFLYFFGIFVQVARLCHEFNYMILAEQLPYIGVTFATFTKYINTNIYRTRFMKLLDDVQNDLQMEKTTEEKLITLNHIKVVTFYAILYKGCIYMCCAGNMALPFIPAILDILMPLNESRPHLFVFPAYYFVDQDKFFVIIALYTLFCVFHVTFVFLTHDMMFMYLIHHSCGLLNIAGYRFKHATDDLPPSLKDPSTQIAEKYCRVCYSIKSHVRAIAFLTEIESIYAINLFLQISNATFLLTVTLLVVTLRGIRVDMFGLLGFIPAQIVHLLVLMYQGQCVSNTNDSLYNSLYEATWYNEPAKIQALYVLALRRSLTPRILTAGGLIELNMDNFANITKAAVSYCTFLQSTQ